MNLAARLCSAAKSGQILVSEVVATELEETLSLILLPPISAKGFREPVRVFEIDLVKLSPSTNQVEPPVTTLPQHSHVRLVGCIRWVDATPSKS